ncbi:RNA polymerase sigma factor [Gaoshiqia sp. Z1-71]|uniref:RNA polymerase sigma factor n=1 Tax=Gaoshiqia hydrogeniformans TaxID=3290090 RepID=UPI003BF8C43A
MSETEKIQSESKLWNDFILGSEDAFKIIYERYAQQLYKFGLHFSKKEDLIFDAIQDIFVDLYKYRATLKSTNSIKLYLFLSLKRKIFRLIGQENRFFSIDSEKAAFAYSLTLGDDETIEDERLKLLEKAMEELSDRQREAIYLRYVMGLDYDELAEILHLNYQSARNLIHRGMEKLKKSCQKDSICLFMLYKMLKDRGFKITE